MARRRRLSEDSRSEHGGGNSLRWLLTYADMITLLMAFFIMMYSMSILNLNKFQQVAISIRSGFGGMSDGQGKSIIGTSGQFGIKPSPVEGDSLGVPWQVVQNIQRLVKERDLEDCVSLRPDERGLVVSLVTDQALFEKGNADISPVTQELICSLAATLKSVPNAIQVEGHTCNLPISNRYPSNWELSTARATNVVRCFIEEVGIPAWRLSAAGYADSKPLAPNDCEKNRATNRRVDIVVLKNGTISGGEVCENNL